MDSNVVKGYLEMKIRVKDTSVKNARDLSHGMGRRNDYRE